MRFCAQNLTLRTISQLEGQVVMAFGCGGGSARKSDRSAALIETRRTNSCRSCGQMIMRSRYNKKKRSELVREFWICGTWSGTFVQSCLTCVVLRATTVRDLAPPRCDRHFRIPFRKHGICHMLCSLRFWM